MKNGPGIRPAGSARRLDCSFLPDPFHEFTISTSGRDSLNVNDAMNRQGLSRTEMGTIVHFTLIEKCRARCAFERRQWAGSRLNAMQHYDHWIGLKPSFIKDAARSLISTPSKVLRRSPIQQLKPALQAKARIEP